MASVKKASKNKGKQPKTRPTSTAAISQPVVDDASLQTSLSAFSDDGHLFAYLALTVDKHRLRVYNTASGQSLADHTLDNARVSHLSWGSFNFASEAQNAAAENDAQSPSKKKRKKRSSLAATEHQSAIGTEVVILGLSDGSISFFSPSHARVIRTLSHPSSSTPILTVASAEGSNPSAVWSSSEDGTVRCWDLQKNDILDSWKTDDRIPYTSLAVRPSDEDDRTDLLVAHHKIRLLSRVIDPTNISSSKKPTQVASFTGHASSITLTRWADSQTPPERFATMAQGDRFLYVWDIEGDSLDGKASASVPLDSDARTFSISRSRTSTLATLSASGKVSIYPIPQELTPPANTSRVSHNLATLLPRSTITTSSKNSASSAPLVNITFSSTDSASITVARLVKGVRPLFHSIKFMDDSGNYIPDIKLEDIDLSAVKSDAPVRIVS
ncbi:hypothetical protein EST38_g9846 [Candolleomyces aberdarensis]|uniref:WD40 repeat-like protein n=1 Tax=Candolleomyces aberdarensis TaxID=2316362 RepID=A0A4V1Q2R5_9AGAR|nr:hypothetical protein EST38_g9846 [Candolleomyces aberdarensis]